MCRVHSYLEDYPQNPSNTDTLSSLLNNLNFILNYPQHLRRCFLLHRLFLPSHHKTSGNEKGFLHLLKPKNIWCVKTRSLYSNNLIFNGLLISFLFSFPCWRGFHSGSKMQRYSNPSTLREVLVCVLRKSIR